jgi:hypothetical protein
MDVIKVEPDSNSETSLTPLLPYGQHIGTKQGAEHVPVALPTVKTEVKVRCENNLFFMDVEVSQFSIQILAYEIEFVKQLLSDNLIEVCRRCLCHMDIS